MKTNLIDGQKILFIGDSITDCDRDINNNGSLGFGYVKIFNDLLLMNEPEKSIKVINKGIGGNTLGHLLSRWGDDVYEDTPDVLSILIGINDATRLLDKSTSYHLDPAKYKQVFCELLTDTRKVLPNTRIILIEPFFLSKGENPSGSYRNKLKKIVQEYINSVNELVCEYETDLIKINGKFNEILKYKPSSTLSEDRIHLKHVGHLIIAEEIYKTLAQKGVNYV